MKILLGIMLKEIKAKFTLICCLIIAVGTGFLLLYANSSLEHLLNDYLLVQNFDGFIPLLSITIGMFVLVFGLNVLGAYLRADFQYNALTHLIEYYVARLLRAKNSYFTNRSSADIFIRLFESSDGVAFFAVSILRIVLSFVIFIFYGIIIFRLNIFAGVFVVLITPLYFLATRKAGSTISELLHDRLERTGELSTVTQEAFENVGNVKAKTAYAFFTSRSVAVLSIIKKIMVKTESLMAYILDITLLVRIIAPLMIIFAAMWFSPDILGSAGIIMMLYINITLFLSTFSDIYKQYIDYKTMKPFLSQLQEFDNVELENETGVEVTSFESLKADNIKVTFEGGRVVSVPDFEIIKGEKVMFFGESGIGKSTIFNIIMGLIYDYEGNIYINGTDLREVSIASVRKIFGITFQHTNALTLNLHDNIKLGVKLSDEKLKRLIQLTALESQSFSKGDSLLNNKVLSGGEKSRLGLSQTLVKDTDIILLDEVFSNMDEALETQIITNLFREYPDRAIICISHRSSSKPFFDRVVDFN